MAILDIVYDRDFIMDLDNLSDGAVISIDFPFGVFLYLPSHGYITKSRLIGGI